jgi:hypothetical protein
MAEMPRPVFVLKLRPEPGRDPIRELRHVLKGLLRRHGMRCVSIEEMPAPNEESKS